MASCDLWFTEGSASHLPKGRTFSERNAAQFAARHFSSCPEFRQAGSAAFGRVPSPQGLKRFAGDDEPDPRGIEAAESRRRRRMLLQPVQARPPPRPVQERSARMQPLKDYPPNQPRAMIGRDEDIASPSRWPGRPRGHLSRTALEPGSNADDQPGVFRAPSIGRQKVRRIAEALGPFDANVGRELLVDLVTHARPELQRGQT